MISRKLKCIHLKNQICIQNKYQGLRRVIYWCMFKKERVGRCKHGGKNDFLKIISFSKSGHKIKVLSKLVKSTGASSNSMCNDRKEENRHKQTRKWVWGRHRYPCIYILRCMEMGISEMPLTLIAGVRVGF